jgi:hypothetical protein
LDRRNPVARAQIRPVPRQEQPAAVDLHAIQAIQSSTAIPAMHLRAHTTPTVRMCSNAGVDFDDSIPLTCKTGKALSGRILLHDITRILTKTSESNIAIYRIADMNSP